MSEPEIITLGCRLNTFESEVMLGHARTAANGRPTVIVNTCAVTGEAERQARQTIRRLRRERPEARIIVTGCAAQLHPEAFAAMAEVDRVLGNAEKMDPAAYAADGPALDVADIMGAAEVPLFPLAGFGGRTRGFVQIQQGCDHRCTFCIVPFTRGPSRDVPPEGVIAQVRRLVETGHAEVVLTGIDIASYRLGLGRLAARILAEVPELRRLRLSTVDPAVADEELCGLMADDERLMPHVHLSLQSGDDVILKRMKRRHSVADAIRFAARLRAARPDVALGADLIAGFPTETDAMAARTEATVAEMGLVWLHVFPFSSRPGTPAARMPQVPAPARKERAARLRALGEASVAAHLGRRVGGTEDVLVEEAGKARCRDFTPVDLAFDAAPGSLAATRFTAVAEGTLMGERP